MEVECDIDSYLTNNDYNRDYPLEGISLSMSSSPLCLSVLNLDNTQVDFDRDSEQFDLPYQSVSQLKNKLVSSKANGNFSALHLNAVSLLAHFDSVESLLDDIKPDALCISETRLKDDKLDYQLQLESHPDYELLYDNSPTGAGEIGIYIQSKYKSGVA